MNQIFDCLESSEHGIVLAIKAMPGSRKNQLRDVQHGRLRVCVTQVAEKGKANKAIIKLLCKQLAIAPSNVSIIKGETNPMKSILIQNIALADLITKIETSRG